jgi:hypothetical protein
MTDQQQQTECAELTVLNRRGGETNYKAAFRGKTYKLCVYDNGKFMVRHDEPWGSAISEKQAPRLHEGIARALKCICAPNVPHREATHD